VRSLLASERGYANAAHGICDPHLIRAAEVFGSEAGFSDVRFSVEQMTAVDAGKQAVTGRWCAPSRAVADEDVVDGAFSNVAVFVDEDDVDETLTTAFGVGVIEERAARGFVLEQRIGGMNRRWPQVDAQQWR